MERKEPDEFPTPTVRHPEWCDQQKCTATAARTSGESHRGTPYTMTLPGLLSTITVTANLSMANAPWLTEPYIEIEWAGLLTERWSPVTGTATIPANQIGELLQALSSMAARTVADQHNDIGEHLVRPREGVK